MNKTKSNNTIKKLSLLTISTYYIALTSINTFAQGKGLLEGIGSTKDIREGNIHVDDIPNVIKSLIDIFLGLAGTVAVVFVIIGAYKLLFGSLKSDVTKGRETIIMAITGFAISALAWFIVKFVFNNFS